MLEKIKTLFVEKSSSKIDKKDFFILFVLCFCYGILSFINLGSMKNPTTFAGTDQKITTVNYKISNVDSSKKTLRYFIGPKSGSYLVLASTDNKEFKQVGETVRDGYVFSWNDLELEDLSGMHYLRLITVDGEASLGEISIAGVTLMALDQDSKLLIDEQEVVPKKISHYNSAYFDEVYFARAAYEYTHGLATYEWVHPPLGKLIQSIPVAIMGMNPFSYRLMGNIAGILMIAVMYVFGKALFKKRGYALLAGLFMALDGFHFAQTRIGTVDSHLVLFILSSYYFMYRYLELRKKDLLSSKLHFLLLSGITIGCAIAVKWTGLFAGLGLAILFFGHLYLTYFKTKKITKKEQKEIVTILFSCILYFVMIPILIYVGSYFLFPRVSAYIVTDFKELFSITESMYEYHSTLNATHPFSSNWYTWPFVTTPVWFYNMPLSDGYRATISSVGNIAIWWGGFVGILYSIYKAIKEKKRESILFCVAYLCLFCPYLFIGRCMFLYHYFPVLPFSMLALVLLLKTITEKTKYKYTILIYLIITAFIFIYFYPIVSGLPLKESSIDLHKWFSTWYF